jgi:hypothetical protein
MRTATSKGDPKALTTNPVDFQIAVENPPGRAYTEYVNSVTLTLSTQFYRFNKGI